MKQGICKRIFAGMLVAAMVSSLITVPPIGARAEAAGKDGSAAMNEAYENHESLMPIGPSFSVATVLEWTPECDPDARYNRSSIPLANRVGGFVVNPKANPEAKLMLCALANPVHDTAGAQGNENFLSWAFNYWQYADSFVYWAYSEEGLIVCPTAEFTDAAHTNGVPVLATLGFPFGSGVGYAQQVSAFCKQEADGSFPVADKLLEIMEYYGFDGYFFNQESTGCTPETARRLNEMMRYMRRKCPDIMLSWYDSMIASGNVSYGNAVNASNKLWLEADTDGVYGIDEFFMNYDWKAAHIQGTLDTMELIGRSPFDAFAGLDVQQNSMETAFRDHLLLDENGRLKLSLALYCPNSTLGMSIDGADFHLWEQDFYTNTASDPRVEVSDPALTTNNEWVGMSRFFADKTPITGAPFVTDFNTGHGRGFWVDGALSRDRQWSNQSNQDVMPTWTFIIDSDGRKLTGGYDFSDAYNGGSSVRFSGGLDAGKPNEIMLYSTYVTVEMGMTLGLTYKHSGADVKLVAYYGDETTESYEACEKVAYDLTDGTGWISNTVDISDRAGKLLYALGIRVESETDTEDCQVNLGRLSILNGEYSAPAAPEGFTLDQILYRDAYTAEMRVYWQTVEGAVAYEVYKRNPDGSRSLLMQTPAAAMYLPTVERLAEETNVQLEVVAVGVDGTRGEGTPMTISWRYSNEDTEVNAPQELVNVCLNAELTGVSFENSGEPAVKALDGTAENGSKWCATNKTSGWMSIDLGREITIRRWRVEHAEYGGEDNNMNTLDFALEYKDETGKWVQVMRIKDNHDAVTDVLLPEPITAQAWRLRVYNDGNSKWAGIRIYEWQMFESDQFPQTQPVMMHYAEAVNGADGQDSFALRNVPDGQTVKVYTKNGEDYTLIGQQVAANGKVMLEALDFGTADAGRVYYTTTAAGASESIKLSAGFEREDAAVSAPAENVTFTPFSQVDSDTYIRDDMAYTTMTVEGLAPGDVVYVYQKDTKMWSLCSLPVAEGETSVSIDRVRVNWKGGGSVNLRVKRAGQQISEMYVVHTPYLGVYAVLELTARDLQGQEVGLVTYGVYDETGTEVARITPPSQQESDKAYVPCGTYTLKCLSVPEDYEVVGQTEMVMTFPEATYYPIEVTLAPKKLPPVVSAVTVTPGQGQVEPGRRMQFAATVSGSDLTDTSVSWSVSGGTSADTKIDETGLLTVGADETATQLIVKAISNQDNSQSITAIVEVQQPAPDADVDQPITVDKPEEKPTLWIVLAAAAAVVVAAVAVVLIRKKRK